MHGATGPVFSVPVSGVNGTNQQLVAAVAGEKIRVLALFLTGAATVTLHDATPTALSGAMTAASGQPIDLAPTDYGWGDTAVNTALQIDTTAAVNGILTYQLVK